MVVDCRAVVADTLPRSDELPIRIPWQNVSTSSISRVVLRGFMVTSGLQTIADNCQIYNRILLQFANVWMRT
jgi:hypothetical protein